MSLFRLPKFQECLPSGPPNPALRLFIRARTRLSPLPPPAHPACAAMEMAVLSMVAHPNVVRLYAWLTDMVAVEVAGEGLG